MDRLLRRPPRYPVHTKNYADKTDIPTVLHIIQRLIHRRTFSSFCACVQNSQPTRRTLYSIAFVPRPFPSTRVSSNSLDRRSTLHNMSSDADYAAFLDKANQDTGSAETKDASQKKSYGTKSVNTAVPKILEQVEEYYVSDSDEPFEPVALEFKGDNVSAGRNPFSACTALRAARPS